MKLKTYISVNAGIKYLLIIMLILIGFDSYAQDKRSADERFLEARELAFSGNRLASIDSCKSILIDNPDYYDIRVFMARVLAWEGNYTESIKNLNLVIKEKSNHHEAIGALIDVYSWSGDNELALKYSDYGLEYYSPGSDFMISKAKALNKLEKPNEAAEVINSLLELYPSNSDGLELQNILREKAIRNKITLNYSNDIFHHARPWHLAYLEYARKLNIGTAILRLNYGNRFGKSGFQAEADGYLTIRSGTYSYLNIGYSNVSIFPVWRLGIEPYQSLPYSFELSLGFRYLEFPSSTARIYTGSIGKYLGNYWFSYRFYLTPKPERTSFSSAIYVRRYLADSENYITLRIGVGLVSYSAVEDEQFSGVSSKGAAFDFQIKFAQLTFLKGEIDYGNYEYYKGKYRDSYGIRLGIQQRF